MFSTRKSIFAQAVAASVTVDAPATSKSLPANATMFAQDEKVSSSYVPYVMVDDGYGTHVESEKAKNRKQDQTRKNTSSRLPRATRSFLAQSGSVPSSLALEAFAVQVMADSGIVFQTPQTPMNYSNYAHYQVMNKNAHIPVQHGSDSMDLIYVVYNDTSFKPAKSSYDNREGWEWGHTRVTVVYVDETKHGTVYSVWTNRSNHYARVNVTEYRKTHGYSAESLLHAASLASE